MDQIFAEIIKAGGGIIQQFFPSTINGMVVNQDSNLICNHSIKIHFVDKNKQTCQSVDIFMDGTFVVKIKGGLYAIGVEVNGKRYDGVTGVDAGGGEKVTITIKIPDNIINPPIPTHNNKKDDLGNLSEQGAIEQQEPNFSTTKDLYTAFWIQFLIAIKGKSILFQYNTGSGSHYLNSSSGFKNITYQLQITMKRGPECFLHVNSPEISNELNKFKDDIERELGQRWTWWLGENNAYHIGYVLTEVKIANKSDWPKINDFLISEINLMHKTFQPYLEKIIRATNLGTTGNDGGLTESS